MRISPEKNSIEEKAEFDLIILDMQMKELDGRETARRLRNEKGEGFILGFFTGKEAPNSRDFLLKPSRYIMKFSEEEEILEDIGALLLEMKDRQREEYFLCTYGGKTVKLNIKDILYISNSKNGAEVAICKWNAGKMETEVCKCNKKLNQIFAELPQGRFTHVQKLFLGNMEHIIKIHGNQIWFANNMPVNLSRTYKEEFKKNLAQYHRRYFSMKGNTETDSDD